MLKFKGKYFVYLASTCTNSIVKIILKKYCYSEVNILCTSLSNLTVRGALSEFVWSHVFFAGFICSLLLESRIQFLCYLKLGNFKLMLLLFPALAFFLSSFSSLPLLHSPGFYCWDPARWLAYHFVLYPHRSMFSIRQNVFTRRVLIDPVPPVFQFASSNSFVFHILFFLFNMIFRI